MPSQRRCRPEMSRRRRAWPRARPTWRIKQPASVKRSWTVLRTRPTSQPFAVATKVGSSVNILSQPSSGRAAASSSVEPNASGASASARRRIARSRSPSPLPRRWMVTVGSSVVAFYPVGAARFGSGGRSGACALATMDPNTPSITIRTPPGSIGRCACTPAGCRLPHAAIETAPAAGSPFRWPPLPRKRPRPWSRGPTTRVPQKRTSASENPRMTVMAVRKPSLYPGGSPSDVGGPTVSGP